MKELVMELQEIVEKADDTAEQFTRLLNRIDELKEAILHLKKIRK